MLFDEMCQIAKNIASQRMSSNTPLSFNDTICVVYTRSSKIYAGVSSTAMVNNMPMVTHAEVDVCNNLVSENDTAVAEMSLFNAGNFQPVLPCNDCAARIISLNPYNTNTIILLPDQNIPLMQMGSFLQGQPPMGGMMPGQGMGQPMGGMMPGQGMGQPMGGMMPGQGMMGQPMGGMMPGQGMMGQPMGGMMPGQGMGQPMGGMMNGQGMPGTMAGGMPQSQYMNGQYVGGGSSQYMNGGGSQCLNNNGGSQYLNSAYLSSADREDKDDGQILKGRLNKLLSGGEEMDLDDLKAKKAEEKAAQKKKFKLF